VDEGRRTRINFSKQRALSRQKREKIPPYGPVKAPRVFWRGEGGEWPLEEKKRRAGGGGPGYGREGESNKGKLATTSNDRRTVFRPEKRIEVNRLFREKESHSPFDRRRL